MPGAAAIDAVVALSSAAASSYNSCAPMVRFNSANAIDARNGGSYAAATATPYVAGKSYHVRLVVNVATRTYDAYVTPAGGTEQKLGGGYAFRSEQASVTSIANWSLIAEIGTLTVNNFKLGGTTVVSAGTDQTITLPATATLAGMVNGAATLPSGSTAAWTKVSGTGTVTFANLYALSTTATFSAAGAYQLQLAVSSNGQWVIDTMNVTVNAASTGSTTTWKDTPMAAQTGSFTAEFDSTPGAAKMDGVTALSPAAISGYGGCAVLVRFNDAGTMDVRNGDAYAATTAVAYSAGKNYHFRMVINVPVRTYDVYVTPAGTAEQKIASAYAFRSEQATATSLANCGMVASTGSHTVSNFKVSATVQPALTASAGADKSITAGSSAALSGSASGGIAPYTYSWTPTTGLSSATSATPTASPSVTTTYTLTVKDAAGTTATDSVIVTVGAATQTLTATAGADVSITVGGSTTLNGSGNGGTLAYAFSWTPTMGLNSATSAAPTASPVSTTTYTLTVTDAAGKTATDSVVVTVNSTPPTGTTYYVSPSGNDSNAGSSAAPWKTLSKAASTAQAGTTVIVKAGTYYETLNPGYSGASGKWITFKSETALGAILDGQNSRSSGVDLSAPRSYIRIEGFTIRNHKGDAVYMHDYYSRGADYNQVVNCDISYNAGDAVNARNTVGTLVEGCDIHDNTLTAVAMGGQYFSHDLVVRRTKIHYNGKDGIQGSGYNMLVEYNQMYDNSHTNSHQDAFDIETLDGATIRYNSISDFTQLIYGSLGNGPVNYWKDIKIYGNVFFNDKYANGGGYQGSSGTCPAFSIGTATSGHYLRNIDVFNNTFGYLGDGQKAIVVYGAAGTTMDNIRIVNNIFYDCRGASGVAVDWTSNATNMVVDYNCYYVVTPRVGYDAHSIQADPKFVNYARVGSAKDFRLQSTSPCINAGDMALSSHANVPSPFIDMDGTSRPLGGRYDIGAFEKQ